MKKLDIIFIDGVDTSADANSYLTYLFPIAAMLEQNNYSFGILNIQTIKDFSLEKIILELKRYECNIVGMTTTADNIYNVSLISQRIAQEDHYKIILGGAQATFDDIKTIISTNCDVIIRGEGDYTIIKLLNHFIKGIGFLSHIDGITYKDKTEIKRNVNLKLFDPNELPIPQYKIASDSKYWLFPQDFTEKESKDFFKAEQISNKYFISSRGCPYSCIFCVEGNHSSGLREKKPERVLQELDYFVECVNDNIIVISDSTFTSSYKRVIEICNKIKELRKKHEIYWYAEGRANILAKHPDLISIMKNAGLIALQIGIESGSQEVLDIQNKRISLNDMRVVAKEIAKVENVMLIGNIILGQSGDNESTYQESLLFIEELLELADFNLFISSGYLVPYVGTLIREKSKDFNLNILIDEFEYNQYSGYEYPICLPNNLSLSELENWKIIFNNTIYDFINKKLRQKSKKEIDRHIKWCLELEKKESLSKLHGITLLCPVRL